MPPHFTPSRPLSVDWEVCDRFSNSKRTPFGSILRYGVLKGSGGPYQGRRLAHFCLVYTLSGTTEYEDELTGKHTLTPGDLLLIHPKVAHWYGNADRGGWDEFFIVFEGPWFDLWAARELLDPRNPIINLQPVSYWYSRLIACVDDLKWTGLAGNVRQLLELQHILTDILEAQSSSGITNNAWLAKARMILESNFGDEIDWSGLAGSLGMSFDKFRKAFSRLMGVSPGRYRSAKVIDQACELITKEQRHGKEIAEVLGFSDEYHFSRRFKQITGLSPTQFRKQWLSARERR